MKYIRLCVVILAGLFVVTGLQAVSENLTVKRRMSERMDLLDTLKRTGAIGENNEGYIEVRGSVTDKQEEVIVEENRDRLTIYAIIAIKTDSSRDEVGRHRATQIAQRSLPGIWLQDSEGNWRQK